jgi:hypothetical protein
MRLSPRVLAAAGLVLLAVAVVGALVFRTPSPPVAPVTTEPTITTAPVPVPRVGVEHIGPLSAVVTWPEPGRATVTWGPQGMEPLLWSSGEGSVTLRGLAIDTTYDVSIRTGDLTRALSFTTTAARSGPNASIRNGNVSVDGAPFFPLLTWQECPARWEPELKQGISLFAGNPCTGLPSLLTTLAGRAFATGTTDDTQTAGVIGWFQPDEADGRGLDGAALPSTVPEGLRFLTLTNHFWSGAAPLPQGKGIYPGLIEKADVVGFDLYPLQEFCRPDLLPTVFDAQRELVALAPGKPTFQWIEVRRMKCPNEITPATIRAESWLSIAGGARGLGFFPGDWGNEVGNSIAGIAARVRQLGPALFRPPLPVEADAPLVRASARELNGALYVIAVNAGLTSARVRLTQPALSDRSVRVAGADVTLVAHNGALEDVLPPLGVRIYVAPPA